MINFPSGDDTVSEQHVPGRSRVFAPAPLSRSPVTQAGLPQPSDTLYDTPYLLWDSTSRRRPVRGLIWLPFSWICRPLLSMPCSDVLPFRCFLRAMPSTIPEII